MKKSILIRTVTECAKQYRDELLDKSLYLICSDKRQELSTIELHFYKRNFLHLTGVETTLTADRFFDACVKGRLKELDINERKDGTTTQKLKILPSLMTKNMSANMIGDSLKEGIGLITDKVVGNIKGCMGFVIDDLTGKYVPNTVINDDIRKRVTNPRRILLIYRKQEKEDNYEEMVYVAKGIKLNKVLSKLNAENNNR